MHKKYKSLFLIFLALALTLSACAPAADNTVDDTGTETDLPAANPGYSELLATGGSGDPTAAAEATISYRLSTEQWLEDDAFAATCEKLANYTGSIDEIIIACDHKDTPYMDETMLAQYSTALAARITTLKDLGFKSVGINMQQTLGDSENNATRLPVSRVTTAVNQNGAISKLQLCPTADSVLDYIALKYTTFAKTGPDFILVDDDFSTADKDVPYTCFCNTCMAAFNEANGTNYVRASLVTELSAAGADNVTEEVQALRRQWSDFTVSTWCSVLTLIKDTVAAVDPAIALSLTSTPPANNAQALGNYESMAAALGATKVVTTNNYKDADFLRNVINAAVDTAGQTVKFDSIADKQYDVDDYPQTDFKDYKTHTLEITSAIMAGTNGAVLTNIPLENEDTLAAIGTYSPMWDDMVNTGSTWELYGGTSLLEDDYAASSFSNFFAPSASTYLEQTVRLFREGYMSYTPYQNNSSVTVITSDLISSLADEELEAVFSKGVIMDGVAAKFMLDRGLDHLVGCSRASYTEASVAERFLDADLNGRASGTLNYMYGNTVYTFKLLEGAEALSVTENVLFETSENICSFAYENELGGRVVVLGYQPWNYTGTWQRTLQFRNFVEWCSNGTMPVKVMNDTNIASLIKQPDDRTKFMLMLTNATVDDTEDTVEVRIAGEYACDFVCYNEHGEKTTIPASETVIADGYTTLSLPAMTGWGFCVVYTA